MEADDQAIQTILMGLTEDSYVVVDSYDTAHEIWLRVEQMMKGSSIGVQEKKAKLFNEWERFTSTKVESIESYYHRFSKLMNDFSRNKYFTEKIASNLKFLNNLQPKWQRSVITVHQTKDLHEVDYIQWYDFLKFNQVKIAQPDCRDQNGYNAVQNVKNQVVQNAIQNSGLQNVRNQNGLIVVPWIANQNANQSGDDNVVAAQDGGNGNGTNGNQIRDIDEIEEVNVNCISMENLQQASTSEEEYNDLLEDTSEPPLVQQEDRNVIPVDTSLDPSGGEVEQQTTTVEETRAFFESLYNNLVTKVENVNTVNRKIKETNADLTIELARYRGQEKSFEINKTKFDELETSYRKSLSKEKSTVSLLQEEKKKLKSDFKTCEDELLDKKIQLEKKIKELDNILVKTGQSIQMMHMLSPKPDSFYHTDQIIALGYQNPFYLKQAQQKQQSLYNGRVLLEKHDPPVVYDSEETLTSHEKSVAQKFLNEIIKDEIAPLVNQVDARVGNHIEAYHIFADMLKKFDRDDLSEPDTDDTLWKLQSYMHDPLVWRLYDTCGVHHVSSVRGHEIFMLVEKEYPLTRGLMTVMLANKLQVDQYSEMANELLRKIFILANKPRH
ncbi:hypothetical protein Tco_1491656 [Tanacetum coccineum]